MSNAPQKPNYFLLGTILFTILMSTGGLYTSLHLVDIHYREPGRTLEFFKEFPSLKFLKKHVPNKYLIPAPKSETALEVKDTAEEELAQHYNIFDQYKNSESGSVQEESYEDPFAEIQKQDPEKWKKEQEQAKAKETCDINEEYSCTKVDQSPHSEMGGIAVSLFGVVGYAVLILLGLIVLVQRPRIPNLTVGFIWIGSVIGFSYSIYLTYLEAYEIKAYCPYCLASAGFMTLIFLAFITFALVEEKKC